MRSGEASPADCGPWQDASVPGTASSEASSMVSDRACTASPFDDAHYRTGSSARHLSAGGAQLFADLHDDALADPRVELVWQDDRNYLQTTRRTFDVITADPIHPWAQGAAYLYTTEYYKLVAQHLAPGGIACQWLPLAELSAAEWKAVVASCLQKCE